MYCPLPHSAAPDIDIIIPPCVLTFALVQQRPSRAVGLDLMQLPPVGVSSCFTFRRTGKKLSMLL